MVFEYCCPDCGTTLNLHHRGCRFEGTEWATIEKAYIDILACLTAAPMQQQTLQANVDDWGPLHEAVLETLEEYGRVQLVDGIYEHIPQEQRKHSVVPAHEPLATIYDYGSVPGAHDNALFALIAWWADCDLSWDDTRSLAVEWLTDSGSWDRGGFDEHSPAELVDEKRHVWKEGYGWFRKARQAKRVIVRHRQQHDLQSEPTPQEDSVGGTSPTAD